MSKKGALASVIDHSAGRGKTAGRGNPHAKAGKKQDLRVSGTVNWSSGMTPADDPRPRPNPVGQNKADKPKPKKPTKAQRAQFLEDYRKHAQRCRDRVLHCLGHVADRKRALKDATDSLNSAYSDLVAAAGDNQLPLFTDPPPAKPSATGKKKKGSKRASKRTKKG